jgi:hypothetical protein
MPECKSCGRDILADMMFCPYCGSKRSVDATGQPVDDPNERVIGVIPRVSGTDRLEGDWTLIVTDRRIIFAFRAEGHSGPISSVASLSIMSKRDADSGAGEYYSLKYNEMSPEDIFKEDGHNVQMQLRDIQLLKLAQGPDDRYLVTMTKDGDEYSFTMPRQHDLRGFLFEVLKDKVIW